MFGNKQQLIETIQRQIGVDITPFVNVRRGHPRTYLSVYLDEMSRVDRMSVERFLRNNGMRIESNGCLGYAIYYVK